ncbi:SGNH/GDSL hydrolase family protein [Granulicella paludicola]|uniref:SGNH/GDSL hydrolase family protein n=1 Tax=Granulicella paludicola TaxID=474951 RepID=UPI0021E0E935|nr:GDSL-type esterase/lipase family protein [Granulicella paludicola]
MNPLAPAPAGTLKIIAFGDSVVWGNGDRNEHKFVSLVAHRLADATGRAVELTTYAHSGALLSGGCGGCFYPLLNNVPVADVNAGRPNVLEQSTGAGMGSQDVELVLVDGCINDVNGEQVALPFPLNWTSREEIERRVYTLCSGPVAQLLANAKARYPYATVVLLPYFRIISTASHFPAVMDPGQVLTEQKAIDALNRERAKFAEDGKADGVSPLLAQPKSLGDWGELSDVFLRQTNRCFEWAAAGANGRLVPPLDPVAPGVEQSCPEVTPVPAGRATATSRVYLAAGIPDLPQNAYGTRGTHLWKLPTSFLWFHRNEDEMYMERDRLYCKPLWPKDWKGREMCRIDATAHPNVKGEADYADGILAQMKVAWSR